jgi:hypothetical protein
MVPRERWVVSMGKWVWYSKTVFWDVFDIARLEYIGKRPLKAADRGNRSAIFPDIPYYLYPVYCPFPSLEQGTLHSDYYASSLRLPRSP